MHEAHNPFTDYLTENLHHCKPTSLKVYSTESLLYWKFAPQEAYFTESLLPREFTLLSKGKA